MLSHLLVLFASTHVISREHFLNYISAGTSSACPLCSISCECCKALQKELQNNIFNTVRKSFHVHSSVIAISQAVPASPATLLTNEEPVSGAEVTLNTLRFVLLFICCFFVNLTHFKTAPGPLP